jgi:predicted component of type VI protein secretion system
VTFGRREGPAYRHIQLLEPTVSRTHARMTRDGDRWRLTNLSRTNPVIVNGMPLDGVSNSQVLQDSDVVEMGALVFRYYDR